MMDEIFEKARSPYNSWDLLFFFLPKYYLDTNNDVAGAPSFSSDHGALSHFLNFGLNEGRAPNPFFNAPDYRLFHPFLASYSYENLLRHWLGPGIGDCLQGSSTQFTNQAALRPHPRLGSWR